MLFVPVWDMNRLKAVRFPFVTIALIAINALIYGALEGHLVDMPAAKAVDTFALKPSDILPLSAMPWFDFAHARLLTYMFLHGSIFHLLGNCIFLFVFGDNVEDAMGHFRFIVFYLLCGVAAGLAHAAFTGSPDAEVIGASGAVSGVIAAYLMLHPNIRVWVLLPIPKLPFFPLRFSAGFVIGVWIAIQAVSALFLPASSTALLTHLGGFGAGLFLILVMRSPGVRLLDRATGVQKGE